MGHEKFGGTLSWADSVPAFGILGKGRIAELQADLAALAVLMGHGVVFCPNFVSPFFSAGTLGPCIVRGADDKALLPPSLGLMSCT